MGGKIKKMQDEVPRATPEITPEMVQATFRALESEGMVQYMAGGVYIPTEKGWQLLMKTKPVEEVIIAYGHPNITATHATTLEITKTSEMREDGDCIIAVKANKGCKDLSEEMKDALKDGKKVEITIEVGGLEDSIVAYGSPALKLTHPEDMVIRKSDFIDDRTLVILADKSASEIKRELVEILKDPKTEVKISLEAI